MKLRKITVAAVAIAAALTMSACGSDDGSTASKTTTTKTSTAAPTSAAIEVPTAAELNALLVKGLDPTVPLSEKTAMVEGSEQDPELINQVAAAAKANNATVTVLDPVIDNGDGSASGQLQLSLNGQVVQGGIQAIFIPGDNGTWKLSKTTACLIVQTAQLTSPACA